MLGITRVSAPMAVGVAIAGLAAAGASLFLPGGGADSDELSVAAQGRIETPASRTTEPTPAPPAPTFVTGTRQGETVSVERRQFRNDRVETLFSYKEIQPYPPTEAAEPNRPEFALSPDGRRVAYSDGSSVRMHDLETGAAEVVVSGTSQGEELPLHWTIPAMNTDPATDGVWGIWTVGQPMWSPDGRWVAFRQGWWEGSDFGVVELATGAYHASAGGSDLEWLAGDGATVIAGSSYTEPGRVHVSRPGQPGDYRDVTASVPGPEDRSYDDVAVSRDGYRLAVSWAEESMGTPACCAATMNVDGTGFRPLAVTGNVQSMAFSVDGAGLYLVERQEGRTVLTFHDGDSPPRTLRVLPEDLYHWDLNVRSDGALALLGRTAVPYEGTGPLMCEAQCPPFRSRLLVVDPDTAETRHESGDFDRNTAIDGFGHTIW